MVAEDTESSLDSDKEFELTGVAVVIYFSITRPKRVFFLFVSNLSPNLLISTHCCRVLINKLQRNRHYGQS